MCIEKGCKIYPVFNIPGQIAQFCNIHRTPDMIDVKHKLCEYISECNKICTKRAYYNYEKQQEKYCRIHKEEGMINLQSSKQKCEFESCTIYPVFNFENEKDGRFCKEHKLLNMIDVKHAKCIFKNCTKRPTFNIKGTTNGLYCNKHKLNDMVDVLNKCCEYDGCISQPNFNFTGSKKPKFCKLHKLNDMVDVINKKCKYENCDIQPIYDFKGGKGTYCVTHKLNDMIDIRHKYCIYDNCNIRPAFNYKGQKALYCNKHKLENMVDNTRKFCEIDDCISRALYGKPGNPIIYCAKHREKGMLKRSNSKCINKKCGNPAIFGNNFIAKHCDNHKLKDEINLIEMPCVSCNLVMVLDKNNKCEYCNPEIFATVRLAKQNALMNYLDSRGLNGNQTDKIIDSGICGKERPDRVYDLGTHILIIECDENQHKDRDCSCEQIRMINISQSYGGTPVYFIRWNPDDYMPLQSNLPDNIKNRNKLCGDLIEFIINNINILPHGNLVYVKYLYFDDWNGLDNEEWNILM